ncbi:MAG: OmpA family protein [bacterium]
MFQKAKRELILFLFIFSIFAAMPLAAYAGSGGSSWSTPCGFGSNAGTSYLSTPCSSSYNCCMPGTQPVVKKAIVESKAVIAPVKPVKAIRKSTYNISARENDIYFALNSSMLTYRDIAILKRDAEYLKNNPDIVVQIQGNCDRRGSAAYNMALGLRRVNAAKAFLVRHGISSDRLKTVVFGKSQPVCNAHTNSCYALNRNDHFVVISK